MKNVLVIGSGGREHTLAWKISKSKEIGQLFCLPGNPGTKDIAKNINIELDFEKIKEVVIQNNIDLVVIGPEDPLVKGIKDYFKNDDKLKNILFIGPDLAGAMLEGSKKFAKEFMNKYSIPTAAYQTFGSDGIREAVDFLKTLKPPYVLKADGLAAGKGVLILDTIEQAELELKDIFGGKFGKAGNQVVIEEYLSGIEVSVFVLTDGKDYLILPEAKDYKRIGEGDQGLNTGGMGAVSPVPFADEIFMKKVEDRIIKPTIKGIGEEGMDYKGFVFIGLMNCGGDPYVIEYNVRMGDPETEIVLQRIESDFLQHLIAAAKGELASEKIEISSKTGIATIIVSGGYPENYEKGKPISGLDKIAVVDVFHSGTSLSEDNNLVTAGGRVLAITALSDSIEGARDLLYGEIDKINFEGSYYRKDIGLDLIK